MVQHRRGVGNTILVALVLALALAAVLGFIVTSAQGNVLDFLTNSSDEVDDKVGDQTPTLKDRIEQGIKDGLESGGIGGGSDGSGSSGDSTGSGTGVSGEFGPPDKQSWTAAFEDDFEGSSLDSSKWGIGFGWGKTTRGSPEVIRSEEVSVRDGKLYLTASHENGNIYAGAINTKEKHTFGPGSYWEARIKTPKKRGFLPAFWTKPNTEKWPPEIDIMELFQADYRGSKAWTNPHYNLHFSRSACGSGEDKTDALDYDSGMDITQDFHVYGAKWTENTVEWYFDGEKVGESNDPDALQQLQDCGPHYMMLNIHIDKVGMTDKSEPWDAAMMVDWVRVWTQN